MTQNTNEGAADSAAPSVTEVAWAAGLFEGEGYIGLKRDRRTPHLVYTALAVVMGDRDVLERFASIIGSGNVRGPYQSYGSRARRAEAAHRDAVWTKMYRWEVRGLNDVTRITAILYPWLGERRQAKIVECLAADTRLA